MKNNCRLRNSRRRPIERDEAIEILFRLIAKYDGYHEGTIVKEQMRTSKPFRELVDYVYKHYTENDYITSCMV